VTSDVLQPTFQLQDVDLLQREVCYQGFLKIEKLSLRTRLYAGGWSQPFERELLLRKPGVGVLLYDPTSDKVLLVEQFRPGCLEDPLNGPWALELVAGMLDTDENEQEVAIREAQEEAGVVISALLKVGSYFNSPGGSNERLTIYCAGFDASVAGGYFGLPEEHEDIRTVIIERKLATLAIDSGRINNAMSIIALQWLELNLARVRAALLASDI
jgi:ADP-ribose pyrophosphatase